MIHDSFYFYYPRMGTFHAFFMDLGVFKWGAFYVFISFHWVRWTLPDLQDLTGMPGIPSFR